MDAQSNRVRIQEYLRRGFLNVTHKVFGKERQGEKRLWNNFLVNERAGQTVCIHCWKEFSLIRYAHNDKRFFFSNLSREVTYCKYFYQPRSGMVMQRCRSKKKKQLMVVFTIVASVLGNFKYFQLIFMSFIIFY